MHCPACEWTGNNPVLGLSRGPTQWFACPKCGHYVVEERLMEVLRPVTDEDVSPVAKPPFRHPEASHGPCYVLDPFAWELGERVVVRVIAAQNEPVRKVPRTAAPVKPPQMRRVVSWPLGQPLDWFITKAPERLQEPRWAARARELRAAGWSIRRIMKEIGVRSSRYLREILG